MMNLQNVFNLAGRRIKIAGKSDAGKKINAGKRKTKFLTDLKLGFIIVAVRSQKLLLF